MLNAFSFINDFIKSLWSQLINIPLGDDFTIGGLLLTVFILQIIVNIFVFFRGGKND